MDRAGYVLFKFVKSESTKPALIYPSTIIAVLNIFKQRNKGIDIVTTSNRID
jgi:hypothetical protein